jgi:NADH dehydrogenase (ubiquinone) 1 alpha/beta subcomplex 1
MGDAAAGGSEKDQYIQSWLPRAEVKERVLGVVKGFPKVDQAKVSETASFKELGLDSLDSVELVMALEEEFALEIPDAEADKMLTVADAINYFSHAPNAK